MIEIPETVLVEIRQQQRGKGTASRFVDPFIIYSCGQVLKRRGEVWASHVLGRSLDRRSLIDSGFPWLEPDEPYILVEADLRQDYEDIKHLDF